MKVILVGNCQVEHIANFMQQAVVDESVEITAAKPVYLIEPEEVSKLHNQISQCDLLICQPIGDEYRSNIGLGTKFLISLLPETSKALVIPNLYYDASFPTFGYFKDSSGEAIRASDPMWSQKLPWGDYHDYLLFAAVRKGLSPYEFLELVNKSPIWDIEAKRRASIENMRDRDISCGIKGVEVFERLRGEMKLAESFHSYNHPSNELLIILASEIMRKSEIDTVDIELPDQEILLNPKLPIYKLTTGLSSFSDEFLMRSYSIYKNEYVSNKSKLELNIVNDKFQVCHKLIESL
ncbi:WcbI family polysaccharide biosynthesis putative acetyltransferase [Alteromonas australica]|uniref:WcbI family polysaccharide biosynthesis putative acetyltransferase n=1 Tax=Alteromonas australica TaxID=589873 RepID=UPI0023530CDD|nr:WcbI family polysaccharide biosynthesis putative acetyltransferase [Alteromonas australica]|tara:strand:- start:24590 stop:25471 length:882 start_codon:yes stop_codon:yes gene_type:complete